MLSCATKRKPSRVHVPRYCCTQRPWKLILGREISGRRERQGTHYNTCRWFLFHFPPFFVHLFRRPPTPVYPVFLDQASCSQQRRQLLTIVHAMLYVQLIDCVMRHPDQQKQGGAIRRRGHAQCIPRTSMSETAFQQIDSTSVCIRQDMTRLPP